MEREQHPTSHSQLPTSKSVAAGGHAQTKFNAIGDWALSVGCWALFASSALAQQPPSEIGAWSASERWPDVAVHAALLPDGRVYWHPYTDKPRIWDPATNTHTLLPGVTYNPFCAGHAFLPDGRLLMVSGHIGGGGVGEPKASIFDPVTSSWLRVADINAGRWYPTVLPLPNGDIVSISGMINQTFGLNKIPEVWESGPGRWRQLSGAGDQVIPMYPRCGVLPDGRVLIAGPNVISMVLDPTGAGKWTRGPMRLDRSRDYGASVQYTHDKLLYVGGGDPALASAEIVDLAAPTLAWRLTTPMSQGRRQQQLTMLPDGRVLQTHGSTGSGFDNKLTPPLPAEVWDPATERWTVWATPSEFRGYHHSGLLLPDGRILAAGADQHLTAEIFSPPYLYKGARPVIATVPGGVGYAQNFTVATTSAASISKVTLVGLSSVTHSLNTGQRFANLAFTKGAGQLTVTAPADGRIAPPGYYMLFILNGQNVPSVAKIIRIGGSAAPQPTAPAAPTALATTNVTANQADLRWTDAATNESGFRIERRAGATGTWGIAGSVGPNIAVFSDTGLTPGTAYAWRVAAFNGGGASAWSNEAAATTPGVPTGGGSGGQTLLADYFTDNVLDPTKWIIGSIAGGIDEGAVAFDATIPVREINARVEITPRANATGDHFAGYVSKTAWNLTGAAARVQIIQTPAAAVRMQFALCVDMQNFLTMAVENNTLIVDQVVDGDRETTGIPFNFANQKFWRIAHSATTGTPLISFQVSPDGVAWTTLRTEAPEFAVNALRIEFSAGTTGPVAAPGIAIFDRFHMATEVITVPPPTNLAPIAHPGGPYDGLVGKAVAFNGSGSSDPDGTIASYAWDFGDGTKGTGVNPTHVFAATGYYVASLKVTDNKGASATESVSILISPAQANMPPVARPGGPYSGLPGAVIALNGSASSDPDGTLWEWNWDFGDGGTAAGINVTHAYAAPGTYTARLTVLDNNGATGSATATVTITGVNKPPVARAGGPYSATVGQPVAVDGSLSTDADGTIAGYAWNFGDGTTATGAKPVKTYATAGTFTLTLTVTDNSGATNTATSTITVATAAPVVLFADNFNDNAFAPTWQFGATAATLTVSGVNPRIGVFERSQRAEIIPGVKLIGENFNGVFGSVVNFTGARAIVQVPSVPAQEGEAVFSMFLDRPNSVQIRYKAGVLTFAQTAAGVREQQTLPFNAVQHRYWQIRHELQGDFIRYLTSPDGLVWTSQRSTGRKIPVGSLRPELAAGSNVSITSSGTAAFDSLVIEK